MNTVTLGSTGITVVQNAFGALPVQRTLVDEAVRILEKGGLRSSVIEAELACARKAGGM